jgi:SAM-dependent methyltransferase
MRDELLAHLACPACGGRFALDVHDRDGDEIIEASLSCVACGRSYAVRRGVPRLNWAMEGLQEVADAFTHEWKAHHAGRLESETIFGRSLEEDWAHFRHGTRVSDADLVGKRVLDVGCGAGRLTRQVAEHGAALVVGVDMNDAIEEVFVRGRGAPNFHVVQANLFALPFRPASFDLVWSCGVIHHTPDAAGAFAALTRQVRPGGVLFVWVYPARFNPFRATKSIFDRLGLGRLSSPAILRIAKLLSYPSLVLLALYRLIRSVPGLRPRTAWGRRTVKPRALREIQLTWNDALAPGYQSRHREEDVAGWFRRAGFRDLAAMDEPKIGMRGVAPPPDGESTEETVGIPP